jgi:hypothetical protein
MSCFSHDNPLFAAIMPIAHGVLRKRQPRLVAGRAGQLHFRAELRLVCERAEHLRAHSNRVPGAFHRCRATVDLRRGACNTRGGAHRGRVEKQRPWVGHVARAATNGRRSVVACEDRDGVGHDSNERIASAHGRRTSSMTMMWSRQSRRRVPFKRSQMAFACGDRGGVIKQRVPQLFTRRRNAWP